MWCPIRRETENSLHIRMNGHRTDIRTMKTDTPVAAHLASVNHADHSFDDLEMRGIEMSYWICELRTLTPNGLNERGGPTAPTWQAGEGDVGLRDTSVSRVPCHLTLHMHNSCFLFFPPFYPFDQPALTVLYLLQPLCLFYSVLCTMCA